MCIRDRLCTSYKVFAYILNQRLRPLTENIIQEYQAGFRPGRSTIDQLFSVKQILRCGWERDIDVYQIFVDFRQAYDSINRDKLYTIMHEFGIPGKLVRLTQVTMQQTEAQVKVDSQLTEPINITRGLKQGDGLAPTPVSYTHLYVKAIWY